MTLDQVEGRVVLGLTNEQLEAKLKRVLEANRFVLLKADEKAPEGLATWRVSLALEIIEPDPEEGPVGRVEAALSLSARGQDDSFDVQAHESKRASSNRIDDLQEATGIALDLVLKRVVTESKAMIDLAPSSDEKLIDKLGSPEPSVQSAAVTLLARKRNPAALRPLLARLASNDQSDIRRAMGLLVELKNPEAVPALIEVSRARDNIVQREVVFALGAIGGDEAEAYLWSVAQGHDDPVVRASAQQALEELKARKQGAAK